MKYLSHLKFRIDRAREAFMRSRVAPVRASYAQYGEDVMLATVLGRRPPGFFVDVGAHHPTAHSNTWIFYQEGWRGINIDPTPGAMDPFRRLRPRDTNLEMGVGPQRGELEFYCFNAPLLNTFSKQSADEALRDPRFKLTATVRVQVDTLLSILDRYLPVGQVIDFLTIDAEGLDLAVLQSNDWDRYRPQWVLVEGWEGGMNSIAESPTHRYLTEIGYTLRMRGVKTSFYSRHGEAEYQAWMRSV
jgi:FkbM family methyltransferase